MEISAVVRDVKTGRQSLVYFPTDEYDVRQQLDLADDDDFEYIIVDSDSGLIGEQDSITLINAFSEKVEAINEDVVYAVVEVLGGNASSFVEEDFDFSDVCVLTDVMTERELGEYYVDELGIVHMDRDTLETYFDYEAYGRDIRLGGRGDFSSYGYVDVL